MKALWGNAPILTETLTYLKTAQAKTHHSIDYQEQKQYLWRSAERRCRPVVFDSFFTQPEIR